MFTNGTAGRRGSRWHIGAAAITIAVLSELGCAAATPGFAVSGPTDGPTTDRAARVGATDAGSGWAAGSWLGAAGGTPTNTVAGIANYIGATSAAAQDLDGTGVGVALIDTGVSTQLGLPLTQIVNGPDLSFESQAPNLRHLDTYGHGTHMAGIIIGNDPSAGLKGIAPNVKLTSVKVGTSNGTVDVSQVIAAIDWVVENRNHDPNNPIRVLNLSYGTQAFTDSESDPISTAVEHAWRAGIVVVVAGGNGGANPLLLANPALNNFVLSVGSANTKGTAAQTDDAISTFSQRSYDRDVDLLAPGEGVVSLRVGGSAIDEAYPTARVGEKLFRGSGTSQATAVVSASVALLLQKRPNLTPDRVKALLTTTGTKISAGMMKPNGYRELNLAAALAAPTPTSTRQQWVPANGNGSLENARGGSHVTVDGRELMGEYDIFGMFNSGQWAQASAAGTAWNGGNWMGRTLAGDGWTGISWASKTWASATWAGGPWGAGSWLDEGWSGRYWSGRYWSGGEWSGRYWSSNGWASTRWG